MQSLFVFHHLQVDCLVIFLFLCIEEKYWILQILISNDGNKICIRDLSFSFDMMIWMLFLKPFKLSKK